MLPMILAVAAALTGGATRHDQSKPLCGGSFDARAVEPIGLGPLKLIGVRCFNKADHRGTLPIAPDGNSYLGFNDDRICLSARPEAMRQPSTSRRNQPHTGYSITI